MEFKLIADSICDLTEELKEELGTENVPLTIHLDEENFTDDAQLDIKAFRARMKQSSKISTSCPSPGDFLKAFKEGAVNIVTTVSDKLSGTFSSALLAAQMAKEEGKEVYVINSNSASAGEILILLKLHEYITKNLSIDAMLEKIDTLVKEMKTYFALENVDNFVKNGRVKKIAGRLIKVSGIKPIMGSDGEGNISLFSHAKSGKQILEKLCALIEKSGRKTEGESMVITHFDNEDLAERLKDLVIEKFKFSSVLIYPTRGCSSVYADEHGIIFSF